MLAGRIAALSHSDAACFSFFSRLRRAHFDACRCSPERAHQSSRPTSTDAISHLLSMLLGCIAALMPMFVRHIVAPVDARRAHRCPCTESRALRVSCTNSCRCSKAHRCPCTVMPRGGPNTRPPGVDALRRIAAPARATWLADSPSRASCRCSKAHRCPCTHEKARAARTAYMCRCSKAHRCPCTGRGGRRRGRDRHVSML